MTTAIFLDDGSAEDHTGDEIRVYTVTPGDDDGEPTGPSRTFGSYGAAFEFAQVEADRLNVELVTD